METNTYWSSVRMKPTDADISWIQRKIGKNNKDNTNSYTQTCFKLSVNVVFIQFRMLKQICQNLRLKCTDDRRI